ncbi:imm11 family protein [Teredinibacter waterburyi]|uniref:imm11 family protein n=1 Tax=Teredinibacter waterburyi TaxID=1500538 RepID=UPI00165F26A7|nr:hypothetical protein [Teredinibacter waterburyi]
MYYILDDNPFTEPDSYRMRSTGWNKDMVDSEFIKGNYLTEKFDKPFEFELWEYEHNGNGMAEYFYEAFPVMSDELIQALKGAGVDNLQSYPAVLKDVSKNYIRTDYKVVNIFGTIAAADMEKSDYIDIGGMGTIAVGFKTLAIDEKKTRNALLFRLAESVTDIIIHESVKQHLESCNFKYLRYRRCIVD